MDKLLSRDTEAIAYAIERSCINKVRCLEGLASLMIWDRRLRLKHALPEPWLVVQLPNPPRRR